MERAAQVEADILAQGGKPKWQRDIDDNWDAIMDRFKTGQVRETAAQEAIADEFISKFPESEEFR